MPKILIIDDDPDIIEAMRIVLESKNHQVLGAASGEEGLKKVDSAKPDLIILDIMMETNDKGFEIARQLKSDNRYKKIPILMLTAIKDRTGLDFRKEAGDEIWLPVDEYLEKPLKPDQLIAKVEALLKSR